MPAAPVTVLYDADCGFCRWSVARLLALDRRGRLRPAPIQGPEGEALLAAVPADRRLESAHAVDREGRVVSGGDAAAVVAAELPAGAGVAAVLRALGGPVRGGYRAVAGTRSTWGRAVSPAMLARADRRIDEHRRRVPAAITES